MSARAAPSPMRRSCLTSASEASSRHKNNPLGGHCRERDFLAVISLTLTGSAAAVSLAGPAAAAMGPNDKFDLVIKGGDVLDPSQSLRGKRDVGIRWGLIEAVEDDIPAARAPQDHRRRQASW